MLGRTSICFSALLYANCLGSVEDAVRLVVMRLACDCSETALVTKQMIT